MQQLKANTMNHKQEHYMYRRRGGRKSLTGLWIAKHIGQIRVVLLIIVLAAGYFGTAYLDKQSSTQEVMQNENN
jgi:hypothetical protein